MTSSLESLIDRLTDLATTLDRPEDHPATPALHEVERNLRSSVRRIERLLRDLPA
jgi:hypothetical protein